MPMIIRGAPVGRAAIVLALVAPMGGFLFGADTGNISGILLMKDYLRRFAHCTDPNDDNTCHFNTWIQGVLVSLLSVGTLIGVLVGAPLADRVGRTKAMVIEACVYCIGITIQVSSSHAWYQITIGRFIGGLGIGSLSGVVPLYQAESAPRQIRGAVVALYQLFVTFGILVTYCVNCGTRYLYPSSASWRIPIALGYVWGLTIIISMSFMPESPRWLLKNGYPDQARRNIARLRGEPEDSPWVLQDMDEIESAVIADRDLSEGTWLDCFRPRHMTLYRTLLGMGIQAGQQLTGANYFFYFGATIFSSVGISDSYITQIILGAVNFVCSFLGLWVLDRFGRRRCLIVAGIWQSAWLFVFASSGTAKDPEHNQSIGYLMICSACFFILGFAAVWGPGAWVVVSETFPNQTRAKQSALATAANWGFNWAISFFTTPVTASIHFSYGFVFAGCNLAIAAMCYFFLYETTGLSLESVDQMYNDPNCLAWHSTNWKPATYPSQGDHPPAKGGDKSPQNDSTTPHSDAPSDKAQTEKVAGPDERVV